MPLIKSFVLVMAALASVDALTTHGRSINHHALGRRLPQILDTKVTVPMKRGTLRKRCKARPSLPASLGAVGNVGNAPTHTKEASKPTKEVTTPKSTPTKQQEDDHPKPTKKPSSSSGGDGGDGGGPGKYTGEATYYGTGLGACGVVNSDDDMIVAVSQELFDTWPGYKGGNPNNNPICHRRIRAYLRGKHVDVEVTDRCVGCAKYDLDFAPAAFDKIGSKFTGRERGMTWDWL